MLRCWTGELDISAILYHFPSFFYFHWCIISFELLFHSLLRGFYISKRINCICQFFFFFFVPFLLNLAVPHAATILCHITYEKLFARPLLFGICAICLPPTLFVAALCKTFYIFSFICDRFFITSKSTYFIYLFIFHYNLPSSACVVLA